AEAHCAFPLVFDSKGKALTVVIADPRRAHALDEIPRIAKLERVNGSVALEATVRKLIRRHYYGARKAFEEQVSDEVQTDFRCPQCGAPANPDQLQCDNCELLLNPDAATGEHDVSGGVSVVRAMISESTGRRRKPAERMREEVTTAGFVRPLDEKTVP